MFTLDVYFTVHFTIRFSSPFAVSWFMVLQILSACPAQSMDLEKNLPGDSPCPCCCSVYNCPYLWVKLQQFLPNSDKLVSYFPVLTLLFWGMGGSGSQKKTRANKCDAASLWLTSPVPGPVAVEDSWHDVGPQNLHPIHCAALLTRCHTWPRGKSRGCWDGQWPQEVTGPCLPCAIRDSQGLLGLTRITCSMVHLNFDFYAARS